MDSVGHGNRTSLRIGSPNNLICSDRCVVAVKQMARAGVGPPHREIYLNTLHGLFGRSTKESGV